MQNSEQTDVTVAKADLRASVRRRRKEITPQSQNWAENYSATIQEVAKEICRQKNKKHLVVAAFLPLKDEPPLLSALIKLHESGHQILVPVVKPARQLGWVGWTPSGEYAENSMGIKEPTGEGLGVEAFRSADMHLIPALAYDVKGVRLGQGGGYYDRIITPEIANASTTFGTVFSHEVFDSLPQQSWDAQLTQVITEKGIISLR